MERTLENLRKEFNGKIYLYLKDAETEKQFTADAEAEGYSFGKIRPIDSPADNIVAISADKQLSHVGAVGRIAFQAAGNSITRIDYAAYKAGEEDYIYKLQGK